MKPSSILTILTFCAGLVVGPARAQQSDWQYAASIYLFMPESTTAITTPTRRLESTLSFGDALDNLDMAFMGAVSASNGRWSVLADYMLTDLSFGAPSPDPAFGGINTTLKLQIFNGYVTYRAHQTGDVQVDLGAGLRWMDTDTSLTLLPGTSPQISAAANESWVDPVIVARLRARFSDRWSGTALVDYGGFSSDDETWQVLLTADYELNANWLLRGGYRIISADHRLDNGNDFEFEQSGPILGVTYRF
ncbi:Outer membrane protein beta-barrel domain-containing protein [Cribrihabitans marinus]|uniref:Outer membrane protein beta-barrel domain-containing protein n=1 Tax=Cribrihabitans marinus TaxID=1227549 RepID=A0A1H6ZYE9_9RHOB|nr:outer membrane beta-barrel protein [Cribrihabitans marinus]GGH29931.1 hypothetical protein GCM10010973_19730 [Cribrihabitans marinus]SEJ57214.1 Outer membrane protein beta-barrel domain-containing protein [Cribrihabitans marinus]